MKRNTNHIIDKAVNSTVLDEKQKALETLENEKKERMELFKVKFDNLCKELNCTVAPRGEFMGNQIKAELVVIAHPLEKK